MLSLSKIRKLVGQTVSGTLLGTLFEKYVVAVSEKGILEDLSQLPTQKELVRSFMTFTGANDRLRFSR